MDTTNKRFIPQQAKKSKPCFFCKEVWGEGADIYLMRDTQKDGFELVCKKCGDKFSKRSNLLDLFEELENNISRIKQAIKEITNGNN